MSKKPVNNFCGDYSLEESKDFLRETLKLVLCGNIADLPRKERANFICFYENLQGFLVRSFSEYDQSSSRGARLNPDQPIKPPIILKKH